MSHGGVGAEGEAVTDDRRVQGTRTGPDRGMLPSLSIAMVGVYVAIGGVLAVLLPAQVARLDPDGKVAALAVISSVSFAATLFAQPLIGALGDAGRRRGRSRAWWLVGSAAVGAAAVAAMGSVTTIVALCLLWAVAQFALNGADISASSYVVDAYPRGRRGTPSGVLAGGVALGTGIGAVLAGALAPSPSTAFVAVAAVALCCAVVFVIVRGRDRLTPPAPGELEHPVGPDRVGPRRRWRIGSLVLRVDPDFGWAVASRFLFTFGQQGVSVYLLYVVSELDGVGPERAPLLVSALTATGLIGLVLSASVAGLASDRLGSRRSVLIVSSGILSVAMLLPLLWHDVPVMFVFAALQGVALGGHLASAGALISEVLPGGDRSAGRDLGLANVAVNIAQTLAPLAAGAVILLTGGYSALFVVAILAAAASGASALRVRSVR